MRKILTSLLLAAGLAGCASTQPIATKLVKADILPLSLDDTFQFRKQKLAYMGPEPIPATTSEPFTFETRRMRWGAIDNADIIERYGNYFSFFWRTSQEADVTVRLEYRQAALGNYVMAQEIFYPQARGSFRSDFRVTGDDFSEFGRVTAWRALLVVDGRIVALSQSFIWR